ncbi:MAG: MarR family transcriptional regulator [Deltaproteobacteria bacterium]|nr:MarR family transcriptional regulator [Deltaproteobacteria bacterium]
MKEETCIFFQMAKANQTGIKFLNQKILSLGVTPVQAMVLTFLAEEDRITAGELGKKIELDSATLTGLLDRLEAARLIERQGNPDDRRSIKIHLTSQGRKTGLEAGRLIAEANREFLAAFTEAEKRSLIDLIKKMRAQPVL